MSDVKTNENYEDVVLTKAIDDYRYYTLVSYDCSCTDSFDSSSFTPCEEWCNNIEPILFNCNAEYVGSSMLRTEINASSENAQSWHLNIYHRSTSSSMFNQVGSIASSERQFEESVDLSLGYYKFELDATLDNGNHVIKEIDANLLLNSNCCSYLGCYTSSGNCSSCEELLTPQSISYCKEVDDEGNIILTVGTACSGAVATFINVYSEGSSIPIYSKAASNRLVSGKIENLAEGTYIIEASASTSSAATRLKRKVIELSYDCSRCHDTGWLNESMHCSLCSAYLNKLAPITVEYNAESASTSAINVSINASCKNANQMVLHLYSENASLPLYSVASSAPHIEGVCCYLMPGLYRIEIEAISANGDKRVKNIVANWDYDCTMCLDTGWRDNSLNCSYCEAWRTNLAPIHGTCSYTSSDSSMADLTVSACCQNADLMTINVYGAGSSGTVLSTSSSGNTVSGTESGLVAGKYTVVVWAHLNSGETDSKQVEITVKENSVESISI